MGRGQEGFRATERLARLGAEARRLVVARRAELFVALLLAVMAFNLLSAIGRKSITNDEVVHIPAGYYHLVSGDFRLNNEHPPLIKMWAALPLLLVQPEEPPPPRTSDEDFMERTWGFHSRFWQANRARFEAVSYWPRVMMAPLALALGLVIFVSTRRLFGARAGVLAAALYTVEPTFLAHARVVHTDVAAALVYLLFFYTLYRYAETPTLRRSLLLGLACALALLTKFSMLVLLPVLAAGALARLLAVWRRGSERRRTLVHAGAVALVVLLSVNAAYYFRRPALEEPDVRWVATKSAPVFKEVTGALRALSTVVPTYFLFGFYNVAIHNQYGHSTSLLGRASDLGWWYYFPVAFALKTTLPFLLLSLAALLWALWRGLVRRDRRFLLLLLPLAVYAAISLTSHINIGVRHFLPAYPFLFIASGALLERLLQTAGRRRVPALAMVVVVLGWAGFEAARAYPHYTSYMNQLAAARPHWWYLSDSNVEWGDDVAALADYLKARGETQVRAAISGGWATLNLYGVEHVSLIDAPGHVLPETRYTAIGASYLNGSVVPGGEPGTGRESDEARRDYFAPYRERRPEAVFGNSIYLYRER
ncbi:MAG TPA: glycosyltransferase family 39 protein [Pyrinomonadaceae bacterium]